MAATAPRSWTVLVCGDGAGDRALADMPDQVGASCEVVVQNDAPVAVNDQVTTVEDSVLVLPVTGPGSPAANDTDVDGDTLTVTTVSGATGGSVAIVAGMIRFVPTADSCGAGVAGFDYRVSDGRRRNRRRPRHGHRHLCRRSADRGDRHGDGGRGRSGDGDRRVGQ